MPPTRTVSAADPKSVQISGTDGDSVRLEFDDATGLPVRQVYKEAAMGGAEAAMYMARDYALQRHAFGQFRREPIALIEHLHRDRCLA